MKLSPGKSARLIARTAPEHDGDVEVSVDGESRGRWHFERADGWRESALDLPPLARAAVDVTLTPLGADWVDHHVWAVQLR